MTSTFGAAQSPSDLAPAYRGPRRRASLTILTLLGLTACIGATSERVAAQEPRWYRGNLHTHSLWSDGNDFPEMIADWYRSNGYHFLTLSDHNNLSIGDRWIAADAPAKRGAIQAIERYRARFGDDWVETRDREGVAQVRLKPLDEFRDRLESPGEFLLIQAEEITDGFGSLPIHINSTNLDEMIRPQGGASVRATIEADLAAVDAQAARLGKPILAHLNHPNFGWGVTPVDLAAVTREHFFEIFNGHPSVNQLGDATRPDLERFWDIANTLRLVHYGGRPLYGVATDDAHHYFGGQGATAGRGWVQVRATELDPERLIEAMERGDFYASSGVTLRSVEWDADRRRLALDIEPSDGTTYVTRFVGTRRADAEAALEGFDDTAESFEFPPSIGTVLAEVEGTAPAYELDGTELYVRAIVVSSRPHPNPSWSGQVEQAWSQPFGWESR